MAGRIVLAAGVVALVAGCSSGATSVTQRAAPPTTTAVSGPKSTAPTATAPPVTSKVEANVLSRQPTLSTSTTTICALSHSPACGPMYFDPAPGVDQPLRVQLSASPAHPAAGQTVTFHLVLDDADGPIGCLQRLSDGVTTTVNDCGTPAPCDRYGAWPPPQPAPAHKEQDIPVTYAHAGTYTFAVSVQPYTPSCVDSRTHRGDQPYSSSGSGSLTITVS